MTPRLNTFYIDATSIGLKIPHISTTASALLEKESRVLDGNTAMGVKSKTLWSSHRRQSSETSGLGRSPIRMKAFLQTRQ